MKLLKIRCMYCDTVYIADSQLHHMDYCPGCQESAIDLEEYYCRTIGDVKQIESFSPPWRDDEDEYHSILMSWLNYSDEEYELEMDYKTKILTIVRM